MQKLLTAGLVTVGMLGTTAPAFAEEAVPAGNTPSERPLTWVVAPFDDAPNQPLMFMGFAKVKANESVLDRVIRLVSGVGLLSLAIANPVGMPVGGQWGVGVAGGILTLTGVDGYCAAYDLIGIRTR